MAGQLQASESKNKKIRKRLDVLTDLLYELILTLVEDEAKPEALGQEVVAQCGVDTVDFRPVLDAAEMSKKGDGRKRGSKKKSDFSSRIRNAGWCSYTRPPCAPSNWSKQMLLRKT